MNNTRLMIRNFHPFYLGLIFTIFHLTAYSQNWEEEAWTRINSHRKSDLSIKVVSKSGIPIKNATVKIKLKHHAFNFGAVVRAKNYINSPYIDTYKELYLKYFNSGGFSLGLKPRQKGKIAEAQVEQSMHWFNDHNIPMRGHAFVWEGIKFLPKNAVEVYKSTNLTDIEKGNNLLRMLDDHIYHALPKWNVICWDVVNEPVINNIVNTLLPDKNTFTHWFKLADSLRTIYNKNDVKLVLNENQIISSNTKQVKNKPAEFMTIIDEMLAEGAPIEILGFQSRFKHGMLSPNTIYKRLVSFEKYNLPYQATEFEIKDSPKYTYTDSEVKQLTEEVIITYFSHPLVEGFWHWTFMDDENGAHPRALFNYDGTPKPTGEKWIELMEGKLNTDTTLMTDNLGNCLTRGFKGEYVLEITYGDSTIEKTLTLDQDTDITIATPFND